MDTDSFIVYIKANEIYYGLDRQLSTGKNKKIIGLMKNELGGKIMVKFVGLTAKTYSCLIDDDSEDKKAKVCHKKKKQI